MSDAVGAPQRGVSTPLGMQRLRPLLGRVVVLKIGGAVVGDDALLDAAARDVSALARVGARPVVVHGGGPQIDEALRARGEPVERRDGIRRTDAETLEVVEMVLGGKVSPRVVAALGRKGLCAVGLTGRDARWLRADAIAGRVGRPTLVRAELARRLIEHGFVPVVAPLFVDEGGGTLNVNADTAAGAIAAALGAYALVLLTDVDGVRDPDGRTLAELSTRDAQHAVAARVATGGMIPKLEAAVTARRAGVPEVRVLGPRAFAATTALLGGEHGTRVV